MGLPIRPIDQVQSVTLPPVIPPQGSHTAVRRGLPVSASLHQDTAHVRSPSKLRTPTRGFKAINMPVGKHSESNLGVYTYDNTLAEFMDKNPSPVFRSKRKKDSSTDESGV